MRKLLILLLFQTLVLSTFADNEMDSLLNVLDETVKQRQQYSQKKAQRIDILNQQIQESSSEWQKFNVLGQLFEEYKNYQMDSALSIANRRLSIAQKLDEPQADVIAEMNLSEIMGMTGMYKEALDILAKQDKSSFGREQLSYYYHLYHSIYLLMAEYSITEKEREHYQALTYQYKDSILNAISPDDLGYYLVRSSQLLMSGDYDQAFTVANECYTIFGKNNHAEAMITYTLADICAHKGERDLQKKYLTISAIADLRAGIKEYISLRQLGVLIYEDGDIDRAYDYMKCSMEDAIFCNARLRTLEISRVLPIINSTYDLKMKEKHNRLILSLTIISIMACVLIAAIIYIYKQLRVLSRIRRSLKTMNENLKAMNEDLNNANNKLSESNHDKEEYIGYVFSMCSAHIDKLNDFRKKVNRKIKAGQTEELFNMTNSSSFVADELKEFHKNFDTIFLNLYPNFIEEFNSLLLEKERIVPKEGDLLTPELRIFALVRLGINDSIKIADFLHYSPQTVYNYRLKVRNKAISSKEDFSVSVSQIGQIKN